VDEDEEVLAREITDCSIEDFMAQLNLPSCRVEFNDEIISQLSHVSVLQLKTSESKPLWFQKSVTIEYTFNDVTHADKIDAGRMIGEHHNDGQGGTTVCTTPVVEEQPYLSPPFNLIG